MLEPEQTEKLAGNFSESDLLRYFNCIADTETKLKYATQPRYVLELGLVKLIEMRRLAPIDKILERLNSLEGSLGNAPLSQSATAEKKTLIPEPIEPAPALTGPVEPEEPFFSDPPPETFVDEPPDFEPPAPYDLSFVEDLPERPLEISIDRLEHYEHARLDDAFEEELYFAGDDLAPLSVAKDIAAQFSTVKTRAATASNGVSTSGYAAPVIEQEEIDDNDIPTLPENPTEEDLLAYAERHPIIRRVKRVFRAKIVEVRIAD
jgi:DNA polymerase-3 subunit gamma/tau